MAVVETPGEKSVGRGKGLWARPILWTAGILLLLAAAYPILRWEESATFRCPYCGSRHDLTAKAVALPGMDSHYVLRRTIHVSPSVFCQKVLGGNCAHHWPVESHTQTRLFEGRPRTEHAIELNPFPLAYEESARVRTLVRERLAAGALTRDELRALCRIAAVPDTSGRVEPGRDELLTLGCGLLREAGEVPPERWEKPYPAGVKDAAPASARAVTPRRGDPPLAIPRAGSRIMESPPVKGGPRFGPGSGGT